MNGEKRNEQQRCYQSATSRESEQTSGTTLKLAWIIVKVSLDCCLFHLLGCRQLRSNLCEHLTVAAPLKHFRSLFALSQAQRSSPTCENATQILCSVRLSSRHSGNTTYFCWHSPNGSNLGELDRLPWILAGMLANSPGNDAQQTNEQCL